GAEGAGADVGDEGGAGGGAGTLPQLGAVAAVVGAEEKRSIHVRQVVEVGGVGAGEDVLDEGGSGGGAVALPQLAAVAPVSIAAGHSLNVQRKEERKKCRMPGVVSRTPASRPARGTVRPDPEAFARALLRRPQQRRSERRPRSVPKAKQTPAPA